MGAMVLHVAHRFKHAIFVSVRALLFHCSNFKKLLYNQNRTDTFHFRRAVPPLHYVEVSAIFQFPICANK